MKVIDVSKGYRNTVYRLKIKGKLCNLIAYKQEANIENKIEVANRFGEILFKNELPSRHLINPKKVKVNNIPNTNCYLYNYLPGSTIPWEAFSRNHIKLTGKAMSNMHYALKEKVIKDLPDAITQIESNIKMINSYFSDKGVMSAMETKLKIEIKDFRFSKFKKILSELNKLEKQPIHLDHVRGNILFSKKSELNSNDKYIPLGLTEELVISGLIDFETASNGPRIIDIARTLAFLISDCSLYSSSKIIKYFLYSGYNKRGLLRLPELKYLKELMEYFWIYDFYKFLNHNPYEFLEQNYHFNQTSKLLLKSNFLQTVK